MNELIEAKAIVNLFNTTNCFFDLSFTVLTVTRNKAGQEGHSCISEGSFALIDN